MIKIITKWDIALLIALVAVGLGISLLVASGATKGERAYVTVDGKTYGTYDLHKDQDVIIREDDRVNKFSIKDGRVQMTQASCKNQICVHQGAIDTSGQSIICLPNKVIIEIRGGDGYDAVSQ